MIKIWKSRNDVASENNVPTLIERSALFNPNASSSRAFYYNALPNRTLSLLERCVFFQTELEAEEISEFEITVGEEDDRLLLNYKYDDSAV